MKYLFFILLGINLVYSQQNLSITYELTYKPNVKDSSFSKEIVELNIDTQNRKSIFFNTNELYTQDLYKQIYHSTGAEKQNLINQIIETSFNYTIIKNHNEENIIIEEMRSKKYRYPQKFDFQWNLENEYRYILGYKCRKANIKFGNRVWEAWYTDDIPISDGPYKFRGLTGLILEIYSTDNEYKFTTIGIEKKDIETSKLIGKPINVKDFNSFLTLKKNFSEDPSYLDKQEDMAAGISGDAIVNGVKYNAEEAYKLLNQEFWDWQQKHNNPIEKNDIWVR